MTKRRIKHTKHGPEWYIQEALRVFLADRGWLVERMIGNALQKGIPDLYCYHPTWGERWIDVKNPKSYNFTPDQKKKWPVWESYGCGIYILTAANEEEYGKLLGKPNWRDYWKVAWDKPRATVDELLDSLDNEVSPDARLTGDFARRRV